MPSEDGLEGQAGKTAVVWCRGWKIARVDIRLAERRGMVGMLDGRTDRQTDRTEREGVRV